MEKKKAAKSQEKKLTLRKRLQAFARRFQKKLKKTDKPNKALPAKKSKLRVRLETGASRIQKKLQSVFTPMLVRAVPILRILLAVCVGVLGYLYLSNFNDKLNLILFVSVLGIFKAKEGFIFTAFLVLLTFGLYIGGLTDLYLLIGDFVFICLVASVILFGVELFMDSKVDSAKN